jgi:cell division transport system permease protein
MFMLGLLGFSLIGFQGLSKHLMESSSIDLYFLDGTTPAQVKATENKLQQEPWVKSTKYITPEEGLKEMGDKYDGEILAFAENIALPLRSEYANIAFIDKESKHLRTLPLIEDVIYQRNWVENMTANVQRLQLVFGAASVIAIFIAIALIQSATRLSIFANRFLIKSMQLVGATNTFIVKPYVLNFVRHSLIAIPIAMGLLLTVFYGLPNLFEDFAIIQDFTKHVAMNELLIICVSVSIFGLILASFGSWLSTRRYLRTKIENLY